MIHQDMMKQIVNKNRKTNRWPKIKIKKNKNKHVAKKRRGKTNM